MTKAEHVRRVAWRSKFLQYAVDEDRSVAQTCRYVGISRKTFYKWKRRPSTHGDAGLCDQSRVARRYPRATRPEVVSTILYLRRQYHFGAGRIADYLRRFHQIRVARSTVQRLLSQHGVGRLPANQKHRSRHQRWQRYEQPQPGHRVQVDVTCLERIPGSWKRFYQFTAMDDCTRIRVLKVFETCNQATAIRFIDDILRRLPFRVRVVQTDNGAEFQSHFHWHLETRDIRHVYMRPATPTPQRQGRAVAPRR